MKDYPRISDAELKVMEKIWKYEHVRSAEVVLRLKEETEWNPKTIHTLIKRLVAKKAVGQKKDGTFYVYYPLFGKEEYQRYATRNFIGKMYGGSLNSMLVSFLDNQELSEEEIDGLKDILEKLPE